MNELFLQCLFVFVSDHAMQQPLTQAAYSYCFCTLHVFDAALQLHLQRTSDDYTCPQLCRLMSCNPKFR